MNLITNFFFLILGITTVLTMTFLGLEARTDLPKVPYPTALDFFVFLSFAFIFATIIQFAVVHYFTKYGSGECYFSSDLSDTDSSSDEEIVRRPRKKESVKNIKINFNFQRTISEFLKVLDFYILIRGGIYAKFDPTVFHQISSF